MSVKPSTSAPNEDTGAVRARNKREILQCTLDSLFPPQSSVVSTKSCSDSQLESGYIDVTSPRQKSRSTHGFTPSNAVAKVGQ